MTMVILGIVLQICCYIIFYKLGYDRKEKSYNNTKQFSFYQGDELVMIIKKKDNHYELKVVCKELVKVK